MAKKLKKYFFSCMFYHYIIKYLFNLYDLFEMRVFVLNFFKLKLCGKDSSACEAVHRKRSEAECGG